MADPIRSDPAADSEPQQPARVRRFVYALIIAAAAANLAANIGRVKPNLSANDRSRWCTVWALVERGTYQIDEIVFRRDPSRNLTWGTIDMVRHGPEGDKHLYSSKPALLPTVVAGVYWSIKQVTGWNLLDDTAKVERTILVFVNLVPLVIALVLIAAIVERYARSDAARYFILLAAAFGTFLTTFSVTLNNHTVAAASVVFALYPAMRIVADNRRGPGYFLLAGFFAAFASTNELPAALFGLAMFGLLFRQARKQTLLFFVPAALVPLAAFFATTYLQTGSWKPFYLYYGTETYEFTYYDPVKKEHRESYWSNPAGIDVPQDGPLVYFMNCTVGHHGIFSLSPIFLLSLLGWAGIAKWRGFPLRPFLWMGLALTLAVLAFYLSRTANYNYGGFTAGLRWTFWLIPLWLVAMIPALDDWSPRRAMQAAGVLFLAVSVFSAYYAIDNPWQHPWLFELMEHWGLINYNVGG